MSSKKNQHLPSLDIFHSFGTFASWSWFCWWFNQGVEIPCPSRDGPIGLPGAGWNWPRRGWYLTCHPAADSTFRNWCGPGWKQKKWEAILLPFPRKMLAKIELQLNLSTSKTDIPYTVYLFKYVFIVPKIRRPPKEAHEFLAQPWEKNANYRWDKINLYPKRNMHGDGMACGETTSHRMGCRCDRRAVCWPVDMFSARIIMAVILWTNGQAYKFGWLLYILISIYI